MCSHQAPRTNHALPLGELEPLTSLRTAGLLPLDGASVTREKAEVAQLAAVGLVDLHEGAGDSETQCTGLARLATAVHVRLHVVLSESVRRRERLLDCRDERGPREVVTERTAVDVPLAAAGSEVHAADRFLATADR